MILNEMVKVEIAMLVNISELWRLHVFTFQL